LAGKKYDRVLIQFSNLIVKDRFTMFEYKLRPHHGLCIAFFEGKGYSPEFVRNFEKVICALKDKTGIKLSNGEDVVCVACPNNQLGQCACEKVTRYDNAVLAACDLHDGQVIDWMTLRDLIHKRIIARERLFTVCGDCEWRKICQSKADTFNHYDTKHHEKA
jgi:uncharacterized protein